MKQISQSEPTIEYIFAFSQGAMIATWLLGHRELTTTGERLFSRLKSAILISGLASPLPLNDELLFLNRFV
jgi:hypothetical protein